MSNDNNLVSKTEAFVYDLFKDRLPANMVYHNFLHTAETVQNCRKLASHYDLKKEQLEHLLVAAWLHDTGFVDQYEDHEKASVSIAHDFLSKEKVDGETIKEVTRLIESTRFQTRPTDLLEEILQDADHINMGKKKFFDRSELLRTEWETYRGKKYEDVEWEHLQLEYLEKTGFYTQYAVEKYNPRKEKNISKQLERIADAEKMKKKISEPVKGVETMYRSVYHSHINLSQIADSKANMMISINTIIMSILVAAIGSGFTFSGQNFVQHVRFTVPICILIIACLASVVFAILSASPKVTNKKVTIKSMKEKKYSSLFFGNYTILSLEEFIKQMNLLRSDKELIYNSMNIDIYYLGTVLRSKYRLLQWAYLTFMIGLCISILGFLAIFIYTF